MKKSTLLIVVSASFVLGFFTHYLLFQNFHTEAKEVKKEEKKNINKETNTNAEKSNTGRTSGIGAFSLSLNVKDLDASKKFYETLGFTTDMDGKEGYYMLRNGDAMIGIFKGFFEGNLLTFNPGWNMDAKNMDSYTDVREIHKKLTDAGYKEEPGTKLDGEGPGYFMMKDPDGNMILFDQHR
jgi:lactoylglutathione lyase